MKQTTQQQQAQQTPPQQYTIGTGAKAQNVTQADYFRHCLGVAKKNGGEVRLPLSMLLGWQSDGAAMNPAPYSGHGLPHPRPADYYKPENERFATILSGIRASQAIDDALLIFALPSDNCFAVLDGLTRASCCSILRAENSLLFERVNCRLFTGDLGAARVEMIARNWTGRKAELGAWEQIESVRRMYYDWGLDFSRIAAALGRPDSYKSQLSQMAAFAVDATPELKEALKSGSLTMSAALKAAKGEIETQNAIAERANSGEKVTVEDAKLEIHKASKETQSDSSNTNASASETGKSANGQSDTKKQAKQSKPGKSVNFSKALLRLSDTAESLFAYLDRHHGQNTQEADISEPFRAEFDDFYERLSEELQRADADRLAKKAAQK